MHQASLNSFMLPDLVVAPLHAKLQADLAVSCRYTGQDSGLAPPVRNGKDSSQLSPRLNLKPFCKAAACALVPNGGNEAIPHRLHSLRFLVLGVRKPNFLAPFGVLTHRQLRTENLPYEPFKKGAQ